MLFDLIPLCLDDLIREEFLTQMMRELTRVERDFRVSFPISYRAVFIHEFVNTKLAITEHVCRNTSQVGELLVGFLDFSRSSPDT